MKKKQPSFTQQIGDAIEASGQTRYQISKATGITQSTLSRLVSGDGWIGAECMNVLANYLGLGVVKAKPGRPVSREGTTKKE